MIDVENRTVVVSFTERNPWNCTVANIASTTASSASQTVGLSCG